jgi:hypothetical protein
MILVASTTCRNETCKSRYKNKAPLRVSKGIMETDSTTNSDPDPSPKNTQSQINTYHCICTTLLLATTHTLSSLPRRAEPALDKALILPLPPASRLAAAGETAKEGEDDAEPQASDESGDVGYSLLLATTQDRKPTMVRREDGFERRVLLRCGRCRLVVGYKLDGAHFGTEGLEAVGKGTDGEQGRGDAELERKTRTADERVEVVYLLPGGLVSSEDLKSGKAPEVAEWREWDTKAT